MGTMHVIKNFTVATLKYKETDKIGFNNSFI